MTEANSTWDSIQRLEKSLLEIEQDLRTVTHSKEADKLLKMHEEKATRLKKLNKIRRGALAREAVTIQKG